MGKFHLKYYYQKIMNLKIAHKLLLSYFILIIIPLSLISFLFYQSFSNFVTKNITYNAKQSFEQAYSFLSYKMNNINEISLVPIKNSELVNILDKDTDPKNLINQVKSMNKLLTILSSLEDNTNIARVKLYVLGDLIYSHDNKNIFSIDSIKNTKWYKMLSTGGKRYIWSPSSYLGPDDPNDFILTEPLSNKDVLSLTRLLLNPENYEKSIGAVRFDFYKSDIVKILAKATSLQNSFSYIENSDGEVVAASNLKLLKKYRINYGSISNSINDDTQWVKYSFPKEAALVGFHTLDNTDWHMITVIPYGNIISVSRNMLDKLFLLSLIIITCAFLLAFLISYSITNGISVLSHKMRNLHNGKLESIPTSARKDEVGMLIEDYNYMAVRMTELIEEEYKSGQAIKSAELKALQSQINPHFLYNTLDMINWFALSNKSDEITSVVDALAQFYKISLSSGRDVISIRDEINHVSSYFQIQNMRFRNSLTLILDVDEGIMDLSILKITLQPIVENAIMHGILCKESKSGTIGISGHLVDSGILFIVQDDGVGMSQEILRNIQQKKIKSKKGSGFGIKNIDDRIKLFYGTQYGLFFSTELTKGTRVEIRIPANTY